MSTPQGGPAPSFVSPSGDRPGGGNGAGNPIPGLPSSASTSQPVYIPSTPTQREYHHQQPIPGSIPNPTPSSLTRTSSLSRPPGRRPSVANGTPVGSATPVPSTPGSSGVARRPSRAHHPPMTAPTPTRHLSHDEAIEALRAFLKDRSSYDVFPVSFRLIVLDSQLKVKKALDVMLLYGGLPSSCSR